MDAPTGHLSAVMLLSNNCSLPGRQLNVYLCVCVLFNIDCVVNVNLSSEASMIVL